MNASALSLDTLITHVKNLAHSEGPLTCLASAVQVGANLSYHADALIGHFVDQARRSGASWSQIDASVGVSKQAAQQRYPAGPGRVFSRFTARARRAVITAAAQALTGKAESIDAVHLLAGVLAETEGLAAQILRTSGIEPEAIGIEVLQPVDTEPEFFTDLIAFDDQAKDALERSLRAALRLGHNDIGTEHMLLGILAAESPVAARLAEFGLTEERAETLARELVAGFTK